MTMDVRFGLEALDHALEITRPEIFHRDQGAQFTSLAFTGRLASAGIQISMDGRGRALDNVFVERLWRTVKGSICVPGSYVSNSASSASNNALPRRLTL